uniref:Hyaluronan/mRNA-binding protein domain-containing protein n=1 Tax=Brassica oleracea var. oleracea TaxID=109376 RepID=A0A0D3DMC4_BRAOL
MATLNPFDLLGDDAEDPSQIAVSIAAISPRNLHLFPSLREARNDAPRGGGRGGGDRGSSRGGYNRDFRGGDGNSGGYNKPSEEGGGGSKPFYEKRSVPGVYGGAPRGGRRGEAGEGERPRRTYERRSGTGRGETEEVAGAEIEKPAGDEVAADAKKENTANVEEQKEPEDKEMTLDEYEKILEEKKKSLQSQTTSERKVDTKVFESMQQLSNKKSNDEIFIKLGSDKDKRKNDKEEKAKKAVSINEFLKPAEGENHYRGGGRGGGRGRGRGGRDRGGVSGGVFDGYRSEAASAIGDTAQFPSLGGNWNAMISGYGNLEMASGFFQTALVRGVCESVIITRYMKGNKVKLAEVFKDMTVKTNLVTWNASVMPEIFSARRWTETIQSNARGRHLVLTRLDWAVYCSDAASYQQYR